MCAEISSRSNSGIGVSYKTTRSHLTPPLLLDFSAAASYTCEVVRKRGKPIIYPLCGPIGFVGLMAPRIFGLLAGPNHSWRMPVTALFGAVFLIFCDTLARTIIAPAQLPIGNLTSLLGGPFFLRLLLGHSQHIETN
jgi:hypothetical protein